MGNSTVDVSLVVAMEVLFPNLAKVFIIAYFLIRLFCLRINVYILESNTAVTFDFWNRRHDEWVAVHGLIISATSAFDGELSNIYSFRVALYP
jgi:hypothetical protein